MQSRDICESGDIWPEWGHFHESVNTCETFRQLWKMVIFCCIFMKSVDINVKWGQLQSLRTLVGVLLKNGDIYVKRGHLARMGMFA